jgi:hypothetical protein
MLQKLKTDLAQHSTAYLLTIAIGGGLIVAIAYGGSPE